MLMAQRRSALLVIAAALAGCVAYYPVPGPGPSTFDRAWDAALGAATDNGVAVSVADRGTGRIRGSRGAAAASINLLTQADGSVRVEINATGPGQSGAVLTDQLTAAYHRRMGR
jgi:hypothetical protein